MSAFDPAVSPGRCARAILPAPAGRTSGGFLVNDRLIRAGGPAVSEVATTGELTAELDALGSDDLAIVDSLFLFDAEQAAELERAARRLPIVLIAHSLPSLIPGDEPSARRLHLAGERAFLAACAGAIAPSAFMAGALVRRGMGPHAIAVIAPAPVCDGREGAGPQADASAARAPGRAARLLTVANWTPAKAISHAALALASLADLDWRWTVVGDRSHESAYVQRVLADLARAGLEDRVELLDPVPSSELGARYRDADLFLLPSLMESYGLVYAEAISHGLPVVGYRCAAVAEVVGEAGVLVPTGRVDLLARAIRDLLAGAPVREGSNGAVHSETDAIALVREHSVARAASLPRWSTARTRFSAAIERLCATAVNVSDAVRAAEGGTS